MRLNGRVKALEGIVIPPMVVRVILAGEGYLGEPADRRQARQNWALDDYGRDRIGETDTVLVVNFLRPKKDVQ